MKKTFLLLAMAASLGAHTIAEIKDSFDKKEHAKAYKMAQSEYEKNTASVEVNLYLGKCAAVLGHTNEAMAAFERALIADDSNDVVRLELARLCFNLGMIDLSESEFKTVLSHKPPSAVRKNIQKFLTRIESTKQRYFFNAGIPLGYGYDNNKNSNPGQAVLEGFMEDEYSLYNYKADDIEGDTFVEGNLNMNYTYDFGEKNGFATSVGAVVYKQDFLQDDDYDILYYQTHISPFYLYGSYKAVLKLELGGLEYANKALYKTYGSELQLSKFFHSSALTFSVNAKERKYDEQSERDSNIYGAGVEYSSYFDYESLSGSVYFGKESASNDANVSFVDSRLEQAGVSFTTKRLKFLNLFAAAMLKQTHYDSSVSTVNTSSREDRYLSANIGLSKRFSKNFNLMLKHTYSKNSSNYKPAEYSKQVTLLSCSYNY